MHFVSEINTGPFTWLTVVGFAVVGLTVVGFAVVGFGLDDLKGIDAASFLAGIASLEKGNSPVALNPAIKWLGFRALSHNVAIKPAINIVCTQYICSSFNLENLPLLLSLLESLACGLSIWSSNFSLLAHKH